MTPLLRKALLVLLALSLSNGLAPLSAPAKEMRHPETGLPAYTFTLPDDWTTEAAEAGNLLLFSANRSTGVVILVVASTDTFDVIAAEAFETAKATPVSPRQPAEISGCKGYTWFATLKNPQGEDLKFEMTIVRVGPDHVASASLILSSDVSPAEEAAARLVRNGLVLETGTRVADAGSAPRPNPILVLNGLEYYKSGGKEWTRYKYHVENAADYPDALFAAAPELPPCGKNTNSSRTWVDVFSEEGKRLYGFCALGNSAGLGKLWFAVPTDEAPPAQIYIELNDRETNTIYKSNLAPTSRDPRLK